MAKKGSPVMENGLTRVYSSQAVKHQHKNQLIHPFNQSISIEKWLCAGTMPGANSEDKAFRLPSWSLCIPGLLENRRWTEAAGNRFNWDRHLGFSLFSLGAKFLSKNDRCKAVLPGRWFWQCSLCELQRKRVKITEQILVMIPVKNNADSN